MKNARFPSHVKAIQAGYIGGAFREIGARVAVSADGAAKDTISAEVAEKLRISGHVVNDGPMNKRAAAPAAPAASPARASK